MKIKGVPNGEWKKIIIIIKPQQFVGKEEGAIKKMNSFSKEGIKRKKFFEAIHYL